MNDKRIVSVLFFGFLREYSHEGKLRLEVPQGTTVTELRSLLVSEVRKRFPAFSKQLLLERAAIGSHDTVLKEEDKIQTDMELAVLPPVCGG